MRRYAPNRAVFTIAIAAAAGCAGARAAPETRVERASSVSVSPPASPPSASASSAAPEPVAAASSALPAASAPPEPPKNPFFEARTTEETDPSVRVTLPVFHLPDGAAGDALGRLLEADAKRRRTQFVDEAHAAKASGEDASSWLLFVTCEPTLAKPRIASLHCYELSKRGPIEVPSVWLRTFALDHGKVRELKARDFFVRKAPPGEGFLDAVAGGVLGMRSSCEGAPRPSMRAIEAAIRGFSVDEAGMTVHVDSSNIGACGAPDYDVELAWSAVGKILDPDGPFARVRE